MHILLDTHFVLWFAKGDTRLPAELLAMIEEPMNKVLVSEVSVLEIAIMHAKNPSAMPYSAEEFVQLCNDAAFEMRPLTRDTIFSYGTLSFDKVGDLHKDPFDRLLVAQAKSENLLLATHDRLLALYDEPLVRVFI
ncbi:MAG: type II toxin-antitoxin system VapC family toxin [Coriobacteriales bacterium]|nr:type II toxin-antitoxin system VapC family toxin [Coriobacteriales bacterium]